MGFIITIKMFIIYVNVCTHTCRYPQRIEEYVASSAAGTKL